MLDCVDAFQKCGCKEVHNALACGRKKSKAENTPDWFKVEEKQDGN